MSATKARGILDTSVLLSLPDIDARSSLPDEPLITTITLAELTVGPLVAASEEERSARQAHLQQAEADFEPLPFDEAAARAFGSVALSLRRAGRRKRARAFDALIAAIGLSRGLAVYTRNPTGFEGIEGLDLKPVEGR
jgi:predicted nucleic acid-binding protein